MVRNEMDAEDLLQNSFIDVFTKIDSYRYESTIGAWIKRIVINNCINFLKKRRLKYESWEEQMKEPVVREDNIPEHTLTVSAVKMAMRKLPDGYRTVFSLYLLEGYDHKEIGSILEISEATSKSQYSRAKKKLKEIMKTQFI
jgi:RNA polymerase sigma-70 factor (ECF subfamily)